MQNIKLGLTALVLSALLTACPGTGSERPSTDNSGETTTPKPTDPKPTEPKPTEPKPTEPKPTEPKPTEPKPTEPKPTEPKPTEPKPTEPKPTEPKPTEPKPVINKNIDVMVKEYDLEVQQQGGGVTIAPTDPRAWMHGASPLNVVLPTQDNSSDSSFIKLIEGQISENGRLRVQLPETVEASQPLWATYQDYKESMVTMKEEGLTCTGGLSASNPWAKMTTVLFTTADPNSENAENLQVIYPGQPISYQGVMTEDSGKMSGRGNVGFYVYSDAENHLSGSPKCNIEQYDAHSGMTTASTISSDLDIHLIKGWNYIEANIVGQYTLDQKKGITKYTVTASLKNSSTKNTWYAVNLEGFIAGTEITNPEPIQP